MMGKRWVNVAFCRILSHFVALCCTLYSSYIPQTLWQFVIFCRVLQNSVFFLFYLLYLVVFCHTVCLLQLIIVFFTFEDDSSVFANAGLRFALQYCMTYSPFVSIRKFCLLSQLVILLLDDPFFDTDLTAKTVLRCPSFLQTSNTRLETRMQKISTLKL